MNIPLLRQIQAQIIQHPESFDMAHWGYIGCDTTACIAGWAISLNGENRADVRNIRFKAQDILQLTDGQTGRLFYEGSWPVEFIIARKSGGKSLAKAASARIDHFIATEGKE